VTVQDGIERPPVVTIKLLAAHVEREHRVVSE
jgi:hypothetical protein